MHKKLKIHDYSVHGKIMALIKHIRTFCHGDIQVKFKRL